VDLRGLGWELVPFHGIPLLMAVRALEGLRWRHSSIIRPPGESPRSTAFTREEAGGPSSGLPSYLIPSSCRAITIRWISLVPS